MSTYDELRSNAGPDWNVPTEFPPAIDRPAFGTHEWWLGQPELAISILMLWRARAPGQMGSYLAEALTGSKPTVTRETKQQ